MNSRVELLKGNRQRASEEYLMSNLSWNTIECKQQMISRKMCRFLNILWTNLKEDALRRCALLLLHLSQHGNSCPVALSFSLFMDRKAAHNQSLLLVHLSISLQQQYLHTQRDVGKVFVHWRMGTAPLIAIKEGWGRKRKLHCQC